MFDKILFRKLKSLVKKTNASNKFYTNLKFIIIKNDGKSINLIQLLIN